MADTLNTDMVYVCPERDIECGRREANWCAACPLRRSSSSVSEGEMPSIEDAELTWAIAGKLGEFYPQESPRDMEKNHRLARAIQRLPLLRSTLAAAINAEATRRSATKAAAPVCPTCKGNDADAPCAYPSQGKPGCLRDARMVAAPADAPKKRVIGGQRWSKEPEMMAGWLAEDAQEEVQDEVTQLRAALKPFADAYAPEAERVTKFYTPDDLDKYGEAFDRNTVTPLVTMGDFRRAHEAMGRASSVPAIPAQRPIDEETREQLEKGRWCVDSGEPMNKWARAYDARFGLDAAPSHPLEAKAGEDA